MGTEIVRFRSLNSELEIAELLTTAGLHDFDRAFVYEGHIGKLIVSRHEMVHDNLITQTPFGLVQRAFRQATLVVSSSELRQRLSAWLDYLSNKSLLSHET